MKLYRDQEEEQSENHKDGQICGKRVVAYARCRISGQVNEIG